MKTVLLSLPALLILCVSSAAAQTVAQAQNTPLVTSMQGTSSPVPDPALQFSLWQQTSQSTTASADLDTQFRVWQAQRTSSDSINLFKCTTSTDLDNPECVGRLPGTRAICVK